MTAEFTCYFWTANPHGGTMNEFENIVISEQQLREIVGMPGARALQKECAALDAHCRAFIALSPLVLMATAGSDGHCDVSPKGDAAGFVLVLDDRRLVIPDRPGNNRLDGMQNLLGNPHVGLIFLVPGREETLRVNGRAWIVRDPELLRRSSIQGKTPMLAIGVAVEQCFLHCTKAFRRAHLWAHEHWPRPDALPSMGRVLFDQIRPDGVTVQEYERDIEERTKCLY
jgi:PPOX class probable FMN-dependent enzyme